MQKKFTKKDNMQLDTIFTLLPIFTIQKTYSLKEIKEMLVNGFNFSYTGYNLNLDTDFKIFCFLLREEIIHYKGTLTDLMLRMGYKKRSINKSTKEVFFGGIQRLANVRFAYENKIRRGTLGILYEVDWDLESDILNLNVDTRLAKMMEVNEHKMFLNYEDLEKKFGKKMIEKKLFLYFNTFKNNTEMKFTWNNIYLNLGIENPTHDNKKAIKKALENLIITGDIVSFEEIERKEKLHIILKHGRVKKSQQKIRKEEQKLNEKLEQEVPM